MGLESRNTSSAGALGGFKTMLCLAALGLALMQLFVTFRGLESPAGMEHAQLARQVARGDGWVTKCVRPSALAQMEAAKQPLTEEGLRDTALPPLPTAVLVPVFRGLKPWWAFRPETGGVVYLLDRVVAGVGVFCLLWAFLLTHGIGRQLFDDGVATVTVAALVGSAPLWQLALSGSPRVLLLLEVVIVMRLLISVMQRREVGEGWFLRLVLMGVALAAMALTHWMGVVLALAVIGGVAVFVAGGGRMAPVLVAPVLVALGAWSMRSLTLTADPMGAAKPVLQAFLNGGQLEVIERTLASNLSAGALNQVARSFLIHLARLGEGMYAHLGMVVAAPLFFLALLHRFRRSLARQLLGVLGIVVLAAMAVMGLMGGVDDLMQEHQLFIVLCPMLAVYGTAFLAVLWARWVNHSTGVWWSRWGYGVLAVGLSAVPFLVALPTTVRAGLALRGQLSQWPPYAADRVAILRRVLEPKEVILADAPWFTAWYADAVSIWLPMKRTELPAILEMAKGAGLTVGGVVVTPVSAECDFLGQIFSGKWSDWPDLVFRGPMLGFDREMKAWPDFPFSMAIPLVGFSTGEAEGVGLMMAFYTDRARKLREEPGEGEGGVAAE